GFGPGGAARGRDGGNAPGGFDPGLEGRSGTGGSSGGRTATPRSEDGAPSDTGSPRRRFLVGAGSVRRFQMGARLTQATLISTIFSLRTPRGIGISTSSPRVLPTRP